MHLPNLAFALIFIARLLQNILSFVPPGFKQQLNVKFPDSRLAVCEKCKKNFKTRDMCRVRNTHTTAPWTTAYVCITIDDSCLDEEGNYIDKPMTVRMVQWQPYCVKKPFGSKTPVCAACKRTNRTRSFCRDRHKHRHLPWCTVYVLLSSLDAADPTTVVAGPSKVVEADSENVPGVADGNGQRKPSVGSSNRKPKAETDDHSTMGADTISSDPGDLGEDIHDIPESRTFLAKVSCRSTSIHWLELSDFDSSEAAPFPGTVPADPQHYHAAMPPGQMDPSHPPSAYYGHGMGYAAQQHQNALKTRQQYFFQMQQHHQQQYAVSQQQAAWQHHPYGTGPGDPNQHHNGATAGEAAAAHQRRGHEDMPPQQQWAMYYPPPQHGHYPPPPGHEGGHPVQPGMGPPGQGEQYHTPPESEVEESDLKRQRV
jgi:hypothetical protein